jgi:hypothetical protein
MNGKNHDICELRYLPGANLIALRPTKRGLGASNTCPAYDSIPIRPPFHMNLSFPDNRVIFFKGCGFGILTVMDIYEGENFHESMA